MGRVSKYVVPTLGTNHRHRLIIVLLLATLSVSINQETLAVDFASAQVTPLENLNLRDVVENPQDYLEKFQAILHLFNITERADPNGRLLEEYYLAHIKDTFGYESKFVISQKDYEGYSLYIGQRAVFELTGRLEHERIPPYRRLLTNILVSRQTEGNLYYTIYVKLIAPYKPPTETPPTKTTPTEHPPTETPPIQTPKTTEPPTSYVDYVQTSASWVSLTVTLSVAIAVTILALKARK